MKNLICDLAIIIVTYNSRELIEPCLQSIYKSATKYKYSVWVIDNNSTDGTVEKIAKLFPQVIVIQNEKNVGYSKANNIGILKSQSRYVLLLNPDTELPSNVIELLLDKLNIESDIGIISPKLIDQHGKIDPACRRLFPTPCDFIWRITGLTHVFIKSKVFSRYNLAYLDIDKETNVESVAGAFLLIRRICINKVGMLDEQFFLYAEDLDWCYRVFREGWRVVYYPKISILHRKGSTARRHSQNSLYHFYKSNTLLYLKYYSRSIFFLFNWIVYLGLWLRFTATSLVNIFLPPEKKRIR